MNSDVELNEADARWHRYLRRLRSIETAVSRTGWTLQVLVGSPLILAAAVFHAITITFLRIRLARCGRLIGLRELRREANDLGGTLIVEHSQIMFSRFWWVAEDVRQLAPVHQATDLETEESFYWGAPTAWDKWIWDRYLDPDKGKGRLVRTFLRARIPLGRTPGTRVAETNSSFFRTGVNVRSARLHNRLARSFDVPRKFPPPPTVGTLLDYVSVARGQSIDSVIAVRRFPSPSVVEREGLGQLQAAVARVGGRVPNHTASAMETKSSSQLVNVKPDGTNSPVCSSVPCRRWHQETCGNGRSLVLFFPSILCLSADWFGWAIL